MPEFAGDRMWGLKELPWPEPVSWLPVTWGWLLLLALALAIGGWLLWRGLRARLRERYRRDALARVEAMRREPGALADLPWVLRATALAAFSRREVASLRGGDWVSWLNQNGARFEPADAEWLDRLPYEARIADRVPSELAVRLLDASRDFLRSHRAGV